MLQYKISAEQTSWIFMWTVIKYFGFFQMSEIPRSFPPAPSVKVMLLCQCLIETKQNASLSLVVPRQPSNDLFEIFEIERGVSADDEAKDDPGRSLYSSDRYDDILSFPSISLK